MKPILLLGDSHTNPFRHLPQYPVVLFDLEQQQCRSPIFTIQRFTDPTDSDLWDKLTPWFENNTIKSSNPIKQLLITVGEIDIRVHFWRHIPRHYIKDPNDIIKFIQSIASKLFRCLVDIADKYNLEKIVIWGNPPAGEKADYNIEVPFSGSANIRNQLIHIWNREFIKFADTDTRIGLATAYYNFIDPNTYQTVLPNPSHDGVHWHHNFGSEFMEKLIIPALSGNGSVMGSNWNLMINDQFDMSETESQGLQRYDSWVRADQFRNIDGFHHAVHINEKTYVWITAVHRNRISPKYIELTLQKINTPN